MTAARVASCLSAAAGRLRLALLAASAAVLLGACAGAGVAPSGVDVMPESQEETDERRRARIRLELAASYYQQGNYTVALDELRLALQADPNYAAAYGMLGLVYMDIGERQKAEESFQRALRLRPSDPDLNNGYGWFLCQTGREKASIEYFVRAVRSPLYATPAKPLQNAGICSMRIGEMDAAEGYFQRALQVDALNPVALYNLGEIYLKRGDTERARLLAQRLLTAYDPTAQTLWLALRVERQAGNREAVASLGTQLRRRFPASREASLLQAGKFDD